MIRIIRFVAVVIFITALPHLASSQSLSINTDGSTANASAMLDIKSLTKGLLVPRMSRTERDAIAAPATGLMIFQNAPDSIGFYFYNGSSWTWLLSYSNTDSLTWKTRGNAGTNAANNFIGTTDNVPLAFRVNNAEKMRLISNGNVGIGVPVPVVALDVAGSATFGTLNTNTGTKTIVSGTNNNLSGNYSIATGESNTLTAKRSIVAGISNVVGGENNIVGGYLNSIPAFYLHSIVVGQEDTLTASASAVFGYLNKVTAYTGFAAGQKNLVSGQNGTAFGLQGMASGINSFVTGSQDTAFGENAAVFGVGNYGASYAEMALGTYGTQYTPQSTVTFNVLDRILNVGIGISVNSRKDALTILKGGNVGIGTNAPTRVLSVNGLANNSDGAWGVFSDARIKTVTGKFTDGLNVIRQINPVTYNYNANAPLKATGLQIGIVAQELEKIAPYMVSSINYKGFTDLREVSNQAYVFLLINAVKEQQLQIEKQQKETAVQKNINAALQQRVDELEKIVNEITRKMK